MLRNKLLAIATAGLVLFSGAAGATERTFEFTGTVDYSTDARMPVGAKVTGRFSYDDATPADYSHSFAASYSPDSFLSASVSGHTVTSDRLNVYVQDFVGDEGTDVVDVTGHGGMMIDSQLYTDGYFGFRLHGDSNANTSVALPSSLDLTRYNRERYGNVFDGNGNMLANYSIDSIKSVGAPVCFKKNGKPFKKCPKPRG
jgi:hypothetical protein